MELQRSGPVWLCALPPFLLDAVDGGEDQEAQPGAEHDQGGTAEGAVGELAEFDRLDAAIDCQERQQPHGQREQYTHHGGAASAQQGEHQHAERDRDDSDVGAEQCHQAERAARGWGGPVQRLHVPTTCGSRV
jgi:hypothetical protein